MKDILSKRTVDRGPDKGNKFSEDKKDLISLLGENKENELLKGILDDLHEKNSKWNFGGFLGLILGNTKSVLHYSTQNYGTFIIVLSEENNYLKLKIDYDVQEGRRTITYFDETFD